MLRSLDRLDRLDRRWAPGLVRRPEIAFLLIGVLALGAGATRLSLAMEERDEVDLSSPRMPGEATPPAAEPDAVSVIGPRRGVDVARYIEERHEVLRALVEDDPRARTVAVVSFQRYLTPDAALGAVQGLGLEVVGVRYRLVAGDVFAEQGIARLARGGVVVEDRPRSEIIAALQAEAEEARDHAAELQTMIETSDDPEFVAAFEADRDLLLEAASLVGTDGCACVYSLQLSGRLAAFATAEEHPDIRLVDPAPPGIRGLPWRSLLPEEEGRVRDPEV